MDDVAAGDPSAEHLTADETRGNQQLSTCGPERPAAGTRNGRTLEILGKTNFDFIGKRFVAYAISTVLVLTGVVALIQVSRGAANMGIDFAGGTSVQVKFAQPLDLGGGARGPEQERDQG